MTDIIQVLTNVLAEHAMVKGHAPIAECAETFRWHCHAEGCGWTASHAFSSEPQRFHSWLTYHVAVLVPLVAVRERAAAEQALRDAAEELRSPETLPKVDDEPVFAVIDWLDDRAAAVTSTAPPVVVGSPVCKNESPPMPGPRLLLHPRPGPLRQAPRLGCGRRRDCLVARSRWFRPVGTGGPDVSAVVCGPVTRAHQCYGAARYGATGVKVGDTDVCVRCGHTFTIGIVWAA